MRVFLDGVLEFIGSESLTDDEFATLPDTLVASYNEYTYAALRSVLQARESLSYQLKKLKALYIARGVNVCDTPAQEPKSNILIGAALQ